ncbi:MULTISPECIES: hypothetical protein [unclassified Shewanella]|jgi:hypothetical protein|uniref:hypothetical protein n=1 Tax=Shewanella TaxID=22 RepID=UPI0021DA8A0A|nr:MULTISPECIES: hypothetical protein [unclassified Shewanella]MCU8015234.1 hypothetical protein [Shewanella sp. SM74]MCU8030201.1 hypothetical protein [Shewanella sp. SM73]
MQGSIKLPDTKESTIEGKPGSLTSKEIAGKIAGHIGTGRNAKDSFIWMTITWSFIIASGLSALLFVRSFFVTSEGDALLQSIVQIWSVFVPIITLALGYAFGKGE